MAVAYLADTIHFLGKIWRTVLLTPLWLLRECVILIWRRPSCYSKERAHRMDGEALLGSYCCCSSKRSYFPQSWNPWICHSTFGLLLNNLNVGLLCTKMMSVHLSHFISSPWRPLELQNQEPQHLRRKPFCVKGRCFLARQQFPSTKASGHRDDAKNQSHKSTLASTCSTLSGKQLLVFST